MTEVVFEDENIRVLWTEGHADYVLATFGDLHALADEKAFWAEGMVRNTGVPCIGLMPKSGHWYPQKSVLEAADAINRLISGAPRRVGYGGSMGAYAAIKYSRLFNFDCTLANCPQWSIDKAQWPIGFDPGWQSSFRPHMRGMGIQSDDVSGDVYIFRDPREKLDCQHASRIEAVCDAIVVDVRNAGHDVTATLSGSENLNDLIKAAATSKRNPIQRVTNRIRRRSPVRARLAMQYALTSHPRLVARVIRRHAHEGELGLAIAAELLKLDGQDWRDHLVWLSNLQTIDLKQQFRALLILSNAASDIQLTTSGGLSLVYSPIDDVVRGVAPGAATKDPSLVPVQIAGQRLSVSAGSYSWPLEVAHDRSVRLGSFGGGGLTVEQSASALVISADGKYLSSDPSGSVRCDRDVALGWEQFRFSFTHAATAPPKSASA